MPSTEPDVTAGDHPAGWSPGSQKLALAGVWLTVLGVGAARFDRPTIAILLALVGAVFVHSGLLD